MSPDGSPCWQPEPIPGSLSRGEGRCNHPPSGVATLERGVSAARSAACSGSQRLPPSVAFQDVSGLASAASPPASLGAEQRSRPPDLGGAGRSGRRVDPRPPPRSRPAPWRARSPAILLDQRHDGLGHEQRGRAARLGLGERASGSLSTCARCRRVAPERRSVGELGRSSTNERALLRSRQRMTASRRSARLPPAPREPVDRAAVAERARELPAGAELPQRRDRRLGVLERLVEPQQPPVGRPPTVSCAIAVVNGCALLSRSGAPPGASRARPPRWPCSDRTFAIAPTRRGTSAHGSRRSLAARHRQRLPEHRLGLRPSASAERDPAAISSVRDQHVGVAEAARRLERPARTARPRVRRRRGS